MINPNNKNLINLSDPSKSFISTVNMPHTQASNETYIN